MSHIDEALRRTGRAEPPGDARPESTAAQRAAILERYAFEPGQRAENPAGWKRPAADHQPADRRSAQAPRPDRPAAATDDDPLIDFERLGDHLRFAKASLRRRKGLAIATFVLVAAATAAAVAVWPRTYHADARLLAQRNGVMPALSNPGRSIPADADSPTRAAAEVILRRDNLIAMMKKTDLLREWDRTRAPILRLKDRLVALVRKEPTEEERVEGMVGLLERRLMVSVGPEETVSIDIDWPDRQAAYQLVQAATQNFLEARRVGETSAISESVAILEQSASALQRDVDKTFAEIDVAQRTRRPRFLRLRPFPAAAPAPAPSAAPTPASARVAAPRAADPEVARLKLALDAKRQELARAEEARDQELSRLQQQLATGLTMYTENHPTIVSLRQSLASLSHESPQLVALRNDARTIGAQYDAAAAADRAEQEREAAVAAAESPRADNANAAPHPQAGAAAAALINDDVLAGMEDPSQSEAGNPLAMHLKAALSELGDIRARLESARIELATSQAAFKYRYSVVRPPVLPRQPVKPNVPAVLFAGLLAALALAVGAPVGAELASGRRLEHRAAYGPAPAVLAAAGRR